MSKIKSRPLKFRIWDKKRKEFAYTEENMDWFAYFPDISEQVCFDGNPQDNVILTQFIGVADCEGVEIFEGDLISIKGTENHPETIAEIRYDSEQCRFIAFNKEYDIEWIYVDNFFSTVKVVGNIFEKRRNK